MPPQRFSLCPHCPAFFFLDNGDFFCIPGVFCHGTASEAGRGGSSCFERVKFYSVRAGLWGGACDPCAVPRSRRKAGITGPKNTLRNEKGSDLCGEPAPCTDRWLAPVGQREDVDLIRDAALMAGQTHLRNKAACEAVAADGVRDLDIAAGGVDGGADAGIVQIALDLTADVVVQQAEGTRGEISSKSSP